MNEFERTRRAAGLTQKELAELLEVDQSTVSRWEKGECIPEPGCFPKLAKAFGISAKQVTHLFDDQRQTQP